MPCDNQLHHATVSILIPVRLQGSHAHCIHTLQQQRFCNNAACNAPAVPCEQLKGSGLGELAGVAVRSYGYVHMVLCRFEGPATSGISVWDIR